MCRWPCHTTNLTIDATNTTFDGTKSLLIGSGATVTIIGPHAFRNLAVFSGGVLIQQQTNLAHADALTAERFFVACGGVADVSLQGYPRNSASPGAGAPANASGGGHLGRGGKWDPMFGSTAGSIDQPLEAGGGGNASDGSATVSGGGALRVIATSSASIDGIVRANGGGQSPYGSGAGGSVWITTAGRFAGSGSIEARGGESNAASNDRGAGGGGAIALEYDTKSGTLFDNAAQMSARGGNSATGATGGSGTIFLRGTKSTYGDLTIDAKNIANGTTDLPPFGSASVTSAPSAKTAVLDSLYVPPFFAGHYLQVTAPDNSVRGTWRIASVTNGPSTRAFGGFATIHTQDSVAYDGYLLHSDRGYTVAGAATQWIAARYNAGAWQYDNDTAFVSFTPDAGDRIFASFSKDASSITSVTPVACCAAINGIPTVQMVSGELPGQRQRHHGPGAVCRSRGAHAPPRRGGPRRRSRCGAGAGHSGGCGRVTGERPRRRSGSRSLSLRPYDGDRRTRADERPAARHESDLRRRVVEGHHQQQRRAGDRCLEDRVQFRPERRAADWLRREPSLTRTSRCR